MKKELMKITAAALVVLVVSPIFAAAFDRCRALRLAANSCNKPLSGGV